MPSLVIERSELVSGLNSFRVASEGLYLFIYLFIYLLYLYILSNRVLAIVAVAGCVGETDIS